MAKRIYLDFDGVLFNAVQRSLDLWKADGAYVGVYGEWNHWHKYRDWGLTTFTPENSSDEGFYPVLRPMNTAYAYDEILEATRNCVVPLKILTTCRSSAAARGKENWLKSVGLGHLSMITVSKHEYKVNYCEEGDLLIDDYGRNCDRWVTYGGTAICPIRPWNYGVDSSVFRMGDEGIADLLSNGALRAWYNNIEANH